MRRAERSLFVRLLASQVATVLAGLVIVGLVTSFVVQRHVYRTQRDVLRRQARQVNLALQEAGATSLDQVGSLLAFFEQVFGVRVWLFDRQGFLVAVSTPDEVFAGRRVPERIVREVLQGRDVTVAEPLDDMPGPALSVAVPWGRGDRVVGGIVLHAPVAGLQVTVGRVRETLLWASLGAVIVAAALGSYTAWTIARPLKEIERMAAAAAAGRYDPGQALHGVDEFNDMATALAEVARQLQARGAEAPRALQGTAPGRPRPRVARAPHRHAGVLGSPARRGRGKPGGRAALPANRVRGDPARGPPGRRPPGPHPSERRP